MEIKINKSITIYCNLETAWMSGEAYHNVKIYQDKILMIEKHIHGCEDGYEAIFYVLTHLPASGYKSEMQEVVSNHYLCYGC